MAVQKLMKAAVLETHFVPRASSQSRTLPATTPAISTMPNFSALPM
jgi:hypothetical protein